MTTVYLCIGTQKTGTTTLQYFMRDNARALKKQGYVYPYMDLGFPDKYYKNRNGHFLVSEDAPTIEKAYQLLADMAKKYQNIVLSDEIIWHRSILEKGFWEDIMQSFQKIQCRVKVVVYLRRQDDLIQSLWNQKVKGLQGITTDFEHFIGEKKYMYFPLDYYANLKRIESYVGKENLLVRVYETGQFEGKNQDLVSDYLQTIGIKYTEDFRLKDNAHNDGLSGNYIEIKRQMNGIPEYSKMDNFLRTPLLLANKYQSESNPKEKCSMFSYKERLAFMSEYEESNRKTAEEYLGRSDGRLFFQQIPDLPKWSVNEGEMYQDLLVFMIEALCAQEVKINALKKEMKFCRHKSFFERVFSWGKRKLKKILKK